MSGFGRGRFGREGFGESAWSRRVLWDYMPIDAKEQDPEQGGVLEQLVEGIRPSFDGPRRAIRALDTLRDPLAVQGQYDPILPFRLGEVIRPHVEREQFGVDAQVLGLREVYMPSGRFSAADAGKTLTVWDSTLSGNNRDVTVALVVSPTTVLTEPPLAVDAGPLRWELRAPGPDSDHVVCSVAFGDAQLAVPGWVLTDGDSDFEVIGRQVFPNFLPGGGVRLTELEGSDGAIDVAGRFVSASLAYTPDDYGKPITLRGSSLRDNNGKFLLGQPTASGVFQLLSRAGAPVALSIDAGPLVWAMLPRPTVTVKGLVIPKGVVEQVGYDLAIVAGGVAVSATAASGRFTANDLNKPIELVFPTGRRDGFVTAVSSPSAVTITAADGATALPTGTAVSWRLRSAAAMTDEKADVQLRPSSLLPLLAGDFALTVDTQEGDFRQRAWVRHAPALTLTKGSAESYRVAGAISGAVVSTQPLYRVSQEVFGMLPPSVAVGLPESGAGRAGTAGELTLLGDGRVRFFDGSAAFAASDVGRQIRVQGSGTAGNNKRYTIDGVLGLKEVAFRPVLDTAATPDAGPLTWAIERLYASQPPLLPCYDDFDADLMEELIDGLPVQSTDNWSVDRYCWEPGTVDSLPMTVTSTTAIPGGYSVVAIGRFDVISWLGRWKIVDSAGRSFFLESLPVSVNPGLPSWSFNVLSTQAPASGVGTLRYVCPTQLSCDYCGSNKILVTVQAADISAEAPHATDKLATRIARRLETVKPLHVELVYILDDSLLAGFGAGEDIAAVIETA